MRKLLATAAAIAPLIVASNAAAEVVISNTRSTPIQTSNATGSAADDVRIASGGSVTVNSGAAVTLDSNHTVTVVNGGQITMANSADGSTGLLVQGGVNGRVVVGGSIRVDDSITEYVDSDNDGDTDGPFAAGTDRAGVRVVGPGGFTGDIVVESGGSIAVDGNQSYGVTVDTRLTGDIINDGSIRAIGTESAGVRTTAVVDGDIKLRGAVNAQGERANAVDIGDDITGQLSLQGAIAATGYRYTSRPTDAVIEKLDEDDLLQGGSAVRITGDVAGGVIFEVPPADNDPDEDDEDDDGIVDANEGSAQIQVYGSAPAVSVGSTTRTVALGAVGAGDLAYGFINDGVISADGVYDGVNATGVSIGVEGGQAVTLAGGLRNTGTISAVTAKDGAAAAVHVRAGGVVPAIVNTGTIGAGTTSSGANQATALLVDAGGDVTSLTNTGALTAAAVGNAASAVVVQDLSGSLTSITNRRAIAATITPATTDAVTGQRIAFDLRANTTGVTLIQEGEASEPTDTDPDTDGDGVPDSREPYIVGDIRLGSGADLVDIRNGTVVGGIDFGAGADRLVISGGAEVRGALTNADGLLDIDVAKGVLDARHAGQLSVTGLNVGAESQLIIAVDPANSSNAGFRVNGAANLADGAGLGVRFLSLLEGPERFNIIQADSLTVGGAGTDLIGDNAPYLFRVETGVDQAAGTVFVDARRRTAEEAGFIASEASIYDAVYRALEDNEALRGVLLEQTGRDSFINLYEQLLPDHSGGPLMSLASGVDAVTRALTGRNASAAPGQTSAWVQEINFYADKDKTDTYGFRSEGFGVAGGVERGTGFGALGLSVAFTSSDLEDPEAEAEETLSASLIELGLYWRAQGQYWTTWARAAGGYASFNATRQLVGEGLNLRNESDWHGWTVALAGGASYERHFGRLNVRPEVYAEYFSLSEDARIESGGGDGFDLDLDSRDGHLFSAVAAMNIGYGFGRDGWIRPEVRLGWRQNISVDAGDTIGRFRSGGPDFHLAGVSVEGGGPILGFRLNIGNELGMLAITGDAELLEDYVRYTLLLRASFRF